jgi:hypothetical protein
LFVFNPFPAFNCIVDALKTTKFLLKFIRGISTKMTALQSIFHDLSTATLGSITFFRVASQGPVIYKPSKAASGRFSSRFRCEFSIFLGINPPALARRKAVSRRYPFCDNRTWGRVESSVRPVQIKSDAQGRHQNPGARGSLVFMSPVMCMRSRSSF